MIHLRLRTEFSFRRAYGRPEEVLDALRSPEAAGICDNGTWGHVTWWKACRARDVKPILGVEVLCVGEPNERSRQTGPMIGLIATGLKGLGELYRLMTVANQEGFYYVPRIGYDQVNSVSKNIIVLSGANADLGALRDRENVWLEMTPGNRSWNRRVAREKGWKKVVTGNNLYPKTGDQEVYEILAGRNRRSRISGTHIQSREELELEIPEAKPSLFIAANEIAGLVDISELPQSVMVSEDWPKSLRDLCDEGITFRDLDWTKEYSDRMERELDLIEDKGFADYFQVIRDMVIVAKESGMLVGPARGSSAGSLVCYLLRITDVDPILHGLMFERFIDVSRSDFPDIDIDFPDKKRDEVIQHLRDKWGADRVGRIGTVMRYKPKSAIGDVARELNVPIWEVEDVKGTITDRSSGDERAAFGVSDALEDTDVGKALVKKYPGMRLAGVIEGHARQAGTHAAGILVTEQPLTAFATMNRDGAAMVTKQDVKTLNLLKIDCLGLRTLSVLEDTLAQIGKDPDWLLSLPLDDADSFEVLNEEKYAGIFQFEGYALQALCRQMKVRNFDDIASITALARPGPLHCGAANEFVLRRIGEAKIEHIHPILSAATADTYGSVIYQEQVMTVCREMGQFSWAFVSSVRIAMSDSLGDEFFETHWQEFLKGAKNQGVDPETARTIWDKICTFGSWAFNKSHAVSYGLISYWCVYLKAHFPLEFGAACLRNAKDNDQAIKILRELMNEGVPFTPVDPDHSGMEWEVHDGKLVGGLTNIKGIGPAKARDIIERRENGRPMTPGLAKALLDPETPFDRPFEARDRFGDMYENPEKYSVKSGGISFIQDIHEAGEYVFIGKLVQRKLRDMNEAFTVAQRGGRKIKGRTRFLNLVLEDDSGQIIGKITRDKYHRLGKPIVEEMTTGDYCLFKGIVRDGWRIVYIKKWRYLEGQDAPLVEALAAT